MTTGTGEQPPAGTETQPAVQTAQDLHIALIHVNNNLSARIDQTNARIDQVSSKVDEANARLTARIDQLDSKVDEANARLTSRIDHLDDKIDQVNTSLGARIDQVNTNLTTRIDQVNDSLNQMRADADRHARNITLAAVGIGVALTAGAAGIIVNLIIKAIQG